MDRVQILFQDMTYNSKIRFLEEGKDKDELSRIGAKRGIELPSPDIAVFKCVYALVDKENKNKCTLPEEEADKALATLVGKAIDVDHLRKTTVGHWIDVAREKNEIISYGAFWKSNFKEEYEGFKKKMEEGELKVSFEAWGNREFKEDNTSFTLHDIHFAGGALLYNEEPAFDEARVLEFAKVLEVGTPNEQTQEISRFYLSDIESIVRMVYEVDCLNCKERGFSDILNIDFGGNKTKIKCLNCSAEMDLDLTPSSKITKKGRKIKKITQMPMEDNETCNAKEKGKTNMTEVVLETNKVIEVVKEAITEATKTKEQVDTEVEKIKELEAQLEAAKKQLEEATAKTAEMQVKLDEIEKAKKEALVKARREELGEIAKDMKDEDLLDEMKFTIAQKDKEIAELKKGQKIETTPKDMSKGSANKDEDSVTIARKNIQKYAFSGSDNETEEDE